MRTLTAKQIPFNKWIRQQRQDRELSVSACAERAGVKQPTWSQWEHETSQPRKETVKKIADALNIPLKDAMAAAFPEAAELDESMLKASAESNTRFIEIPIDGPMTVYKDGEKTTVELKPEDRALLEQHTAMLEAFLKQTERNNDAE